MKFEPIPSDEFLIRITFETEDIETVAAVYSEHMQTLRSKGNDGSISEFDEKMANPDYTTSDEKYEKAFIFTNPSLVHLQEVFQDFADRTEDEVKRIAEHELVPPFLVSRYQTERRWLGEEALDMAQKLGGMAMKASDIVIGPEEVSQMFSGLDDFLGGQSGEKS